MTSPRATPSSVSNVLYYRCTGRCVRAAFLCGIDPLTGVSFDHRRQWMLDRLTELTEIFAVDVCAYALLSTRYQLVVRVDTPRADAWASHEVVERWTRLFSRPDWAQRYLQGAALTADETALLNKQLPIWRSRLGDLSWFMRSLNQWFARRANKEDGSRGYFWEDSGNTRVLLDDPGLSDDDGLGEFEPDSHEGHTDPPSTLARGAATAVI